jgi:phosphonate transport system ATP-binding protein
VGLFDKALTRCDSLSGGQQQRVGIARALTQEPKLILADEPIASLDPASSDRVMKILRDVCREDRIPVIVSLHQLDFAKAYADRIIGLCDGDIVFDGPPSALDNAALSRIYGAPADTTN